MITILNNSVHLIKFHSITLSKVISISIILNSLQSYINFRFLFFYFQSLYVLIFISFIVLFLFYFQITPVVQLLALCLCFYSFFTSFLFFSLFCVLILPSICSNVYYFLLILNLYALFLVLGFKLCFLLESESVFGNAVHNIQCQMSQNLKRQSSSQRSLNQYQLEPVESCSSYLSKMKSQFSTLYSQTDFNLPQSCVDSLKLSGILYLPGTMITRFSSQCTKTDWESSTYTTKYGSFQMSLTIIETLMDFSIIVCQQLGRGAYSQVLLFTHQQKTYVLKCIQIGKKKEESVELALRQIFIAKIFSTLQIGPKLCQIFGYDGMIFKNKIIFIMQKCETKYTKAQIEQEKINKSLYESLNLMHSLHICHMDIKLQNIGWSSSLNKFVFLDFNLSQVVPEKFGYKSQVTFAGSYHYCSPEMKRLYTLKTRGYVDLYYNDFVGLQITMSEIYAKLLKQKQSQHWMLEEYDNIIDQQLKKHAIISYFKIKRKIFELELQAIQLAIENEDSIQMTMLQLVQNLLQKNKKNKQKTQQIHKLHQHLTYKIRKMQKKPHQMDYLLSTYQQQHKSTIFNFHKINEIANSNYLLTQVWNDIKWKQKIFDFIDVYQNYNLCYKATRQLLVNNLCKIIGVPGKEGAGGCHVGCFRKLLLMFYEVFYCEGNVRKMERIMGYFVLMRDNVNLAAMEDKLLILLHSKGQYQMQINMNLKLFLAKSITMMKIPYSLNNRFKKNLQQLQTHLLNSNSTSIFVNLLPFIQQSITQIKQLTQYFNRSIGIKNCAQINKNSKQFLQDMKDVLDKDNIKIYEQLLIDKILVGQFDKLNFTQKQTEYESFWVEKWLFYVKFFCMQQFNKHPQFLSSMQKQKFNWFYIYETSVQIFQTQQRKQIYKSLLNSNIINQQQFPTHVQYFEILIKQMPKPLFFKYFVYSLHFMPLSIVTDFTDVFGILNIMLKIFVDVDVEKIEFLKMVQQGDMDSLCQDVQFLLYLVVLTELSQSTVSEYQMSTQQLDTSLETIHLNLLVRLLMCELNEDLTGINDTILRLLKMCKNQKYPKWYQTFCFILKTIHFKFPRTTQMEISHLLVSKAEIQIEQSGKQGYFIAIAPDFLVTILNSYAELNKFQQCFIYIKQLCKTILQKQTNKKLQIYFYSILDFITHKCSILILKQFVIDNLQQKLSQFSNYPMLCCFIGFALLKTIEQNIQYQQNIIRRAKLIVYYLGEGENYVAVRVMRMKLAWLIQCREGNKFRTKLYRKMGYTRKLIDVIENEMRSIDSIAGKKKNYLLCLQNIKNKLLSQIQLFKLPIQSV